MKPLSAFCLRNFLWFLFAFTCINASAQPHAGFSSNTQSGCSPLVVQFQNLSAGDSLTYSWYLGNGATSSQQNASAIYITPGIYTVKLVVTDTTGLQDSITQSAYITVYDKPTIDFSANPTDGCAPLTVQFTDKSTPGSGNIAGWIWDFGDGITSGLQNLSHTYNVSDTFDVILTATNSFGCKTTLMQPSLVKVGAFVKAGFDYNYSNVCQPPASVSFINTSQSNEKLNYQWLFGDGGASTDKDPVYQYATSGTFTVQLTATNESGCSNTYTQVISIGSAKANFEFTGACINEPVFFTDSSSPKPLSEIWDFGDSTTGTGAQVFHVYKTQGAYQVTLTADFGGCTDIIRKTIVTGNKAHADFNASGKRYTCNYPVSIQFNNTSQDATGYKWLFGDNTSSTSSNPVHLYKSAGQYTVTLIAYNANGCADTIVKDNFIQLGPPQILGIENLPYEGCAPQTITFRPIINSAIPISTYQWDFGDGNSSKDSVPKNRYLKTGRYNVTLIVTTPEGCSDTLYMPNAVSLGKAPKSLFSADKSDICASTAVNFTDLSSGLITNWLWIFGDGTTTTEPNPIHVYSDTGYMDVSLIVSQYGCYDTLILSNYIYIKPPVAIFTSSSKCTEPFTYTFIDNSVAPETWNWDFGDGNTSTNPDEIHTYKKRGLYKVSLTVTNGSCSYTQNDTIQVVKENPSFLYEALTTNFCKYDSIRFYATGYNTDNIKNFQWDFGDGVLAPWAPKNDTVYHFYNDAGTYNPLLIVRDVNNCFDTINNNINIPIYGPNAAFSNKAGDCLLSTTSFKDESFSDGLHAITKWIWDYGDNTPADTLTAVPFMHTYSDTGLYTVALKIVDNNGCYDTVTITDAINITQPFADFSAVDTLTCSASGIQFIDSSVGVSMLYTWNFGDNQTSNNPSPLHNYSAEGAYNVQLSLKDKYGCTDTISKPQYIRVANPVSAFEIADTLFQCPPAKINPVNNSLNYNSLTWDFGDGNTSEEILPEHYYTDAGIYTLKLIVQGYGNCADTFVKPLVLKGPFATFTYSPFTGCNPLNISFAAKAKNTIQYIWDFGDGVIENTSDSNTTYTYLKPGKYLPQLVIVDSGGCRVPVVNLDTVVVFGVDTKFSVARVPGSCDSSLYSFTDSSMALYDNVVSYRWDFGDGDSSSLINPAHFYFKPGTYNTSLKIATEKGCLAGYQFPLDVLIDTTPQIFATLPDSACINATVNLNANVLNDVSENYTWKWDFGNGKSANCKDTVLAYETANQYNLFVTGTSAAGCTDTARHSLRIDPLPVVSAGLDSIICKGKSIALLPQGAATYAWLPDPTLSCFTCTSPIANPSFKTTYYLTGTNVYGCKASDSVHIFVKQPANVTAFAPDTICTGNSIQLTANGAELYNWLPASLVANSTDSVTSSTPPSTTNFMVIGKDSKGCFSDTAYALVHVFPYPQLIIKDSVITIEAGSDYKVNALGSEDIISWLWTPPAGLSCNTCPQPVAKPLSTQTYTVDVKNVAGCLVEKHVTITVLCKNQNVFIPNTFSPNKDGMNDYFYPRGKGVFTIKTFRIYSRWGILVFERNNFPPNQQSYGWDGTYKGNPLHPDVYVFIADVVCDNGTVISTKGNVTLLR